MNKEEILVKITKQEDKYLISKLLDKIKFVTQKNKIEYTEFLDEYQLKILQSVINKIKIKNFMIFGGFENAERKICILYPEKLQTLFYEEKYDFNNILSVIRINLSKEMYNKYTHKNYLGAIMKLGIKREKIGDIIVSNEGADIIILKEMEEYLLNNLKQLKRFSKSEILIIKLEELKKLELKYEERNIIISSMRLDSIVSEILNISRTKALEIIKQERVFVNFEMQNQNNKIIKNGDIITIRGKGRFIISEQIGKTKNNRIKLLVKKYI